MTRSKQPIRCLAWRLRNNVRSPRWENVEWLSRVCHGSHEPLHSLYFRKNWKFVPLRVAKEGLKLHWIKFYFQTRSPYKYAYEGRQSSALFRLGMSQLLILKTNCRQIFVIENKVIINRTTNLLEYRIKYIFFYYFFLK